MSLFKLAVAFLIATAAVARADPDPRTVHLVNYKEKGASSGKPSFIYRGDTPLFRDAEGKKVVDLEAIHKIMAEMTLERTGVALLPVAETYWRIINLADPDHSNAKIEKAFWEAKYGSIGDHWVNWQLAGTKVYPPSLTPDARAAIVAKNNTDGSMWGTDDLPKRLEQLHAALNAPITDASKQNLVYVHGADEAVGGLITAYRLRYFNEITDGGRLVRGASAPCPAHPATGARAAGGIAAIARPPAPKAKAADEDDEASLTLTHAFALACDEVGKCPTVENTASVGWYCLHRNENPINGTFRDCLKGYRCDEKEGWCMPNRC